MTLIEKIEQQLECIGFDRSSAITEAVAFVLFNSQAYRSNGAAVEISKANAARAARLVAREASRIADALEGGEG